MNAWPAPQALIREHPGVDRRSGLLVILLAAALAVILAAAPGWVGIGSALWIAACVLFWYSPVTGIAAVVVSIPFQEKIRIPTLLDDSTFTRFMVAALLVAFLLRMVGGWRVHVDNVAVVHAAVIVMLIATFGQAVHLERWVGEVYRWSLPLVVYLVCRSIPLRDRDRLWIAVAIGVGVIASAVVAVRQVIVSAGPESYQTGGLTRVFGMFGHPNTLAAFLGLSLPLALALILGRAIRPAGIAGKILVTAGVLGSLALVLTQSRGGWVASACAFAFVVLFAPRSVQRVIAISGAVGLLGLIAAGGFDLVPGLARFESVASIRDTYVQVTSATWGQQEREAHWGAAYAMLQDHPWLGVGAGQFNEHFRDYTPHWRFRIPRGQAHNGYLHMASQAGYPGLALYLAWIGTMLVALLRAIRSTTGRQRALAVGSTGCLIAYLVHSIFEFLGGLSLPILLAITIAIALPQPRRAPYTPAEGNTFMTHGTHG